MAFERFRNSAKAIIVEDGRLLAICRDDPQWGEWHLLPGGGQEPGETLHDTLRREVFEEAGLTVAIGELVCVREYIGAHHEFADMDSDLHQIELMFLCRRLGDAIPAPGPVPDATQIRVDWLPIDKLDQSAFYPRAIIPLLQSGALAGVGDGAPPHSVFYLGDVN